MDDVANEYEFCDFMNTFNSNALDFQNERYIYIPKRFYDCQVKCGQETDSKLKHQAAIDIPRSNVLLDGKKIDIVPECIPTKVLRYCTQTVMAVPVEILTKFGLVAEASKPSPLQIEVSGNRICAQKRLRFFMRDYWLPIEVKVLADADDMYVILKISSTI